MKKTFFVSVCIGAFVSMISLTSCQQEPKVVSQKRSVTNSFSKVPTTQVDKVKQDKIDEAQQDIGGTSYPISGCLQELATHSELYKNELIDRIEVYKSKRMMYAYRNGKKVFESRMSLGKNADKGNKLQAGDYRTPEGDYKIVRKKCDDRLYRSLMISYPNAEDIKRAVTYGVNPGGYITIHGQPKWNADGHGDKYTLSHDWTEGCMAVPNKKMTYLWHRVANGTPITIHP